MHRAEILIASLYILPLLGVGVILGLRRSGLMRNLSTAVLLSGITGALLTACFGFMMSTVPIRPYESDGGEWGRLLLSIASFLYVGFGLGSVLASLIGVPAVLISSRIRLRRQKTNHPPD